MKSVSYSRKATRAMARIPAPTARRIDEKLRQYADDPTTLANNVKLLKDSEILRLRIGDWRILFTETDSDLTVLVIAPRGGVYD